MLDIGWMELVLIGIVALIVVGPKELPGLFRAVGQFMGKARGMAREFQRSMEQAADDSGLNEATRGLNSLNRLNLNSATSSARRYAENLVTGDADAEAKPDKGSDAEDTGTRDAPAEGDDSAAADATEGDGTARGGGATGPGRGGP